MAVFVRVAVGAFLVWFLWAVLRPLLGALGWSDLTIDDLGQWGNSFGALNALIASIGFSAVAYTAYLQRRTLQGQQDQLKITLADQHRQRFEGQFVSLLNLLRSLRGDVRFKFSSEYRAHTDPNEENVLFEGLEAFRMAWHEARHHIESKSTSVEIGDIYIRYVHKRFEGNLGPYFRMVYTILTMIEKDQILSEEEKHRYGNILRSQLTSYELILHGLNGLAPSVSKDFADLITRFHLFKYMPKGERYKVLHKCYSEEAFAARD